jgi:hypothetical protein
VQYPNAQARKFPVTELRCQCQHCCRWIGILGDLTRVTVADVTDVTRVTRDAADTRTHHKDPVSGGNFFANPLPHPIDMGWVLQHGYDMR